MKTRHALLALLLLLCSSLSLAQSKLSVVGFRELENDLTAMTHGTERIDQNGERAALIKVVTLEQGFTFDGGSLGIVHSEQHKGEVWVYVPAHAMHITINHPYFGVLRNYYYPVGIRAGRTYEMLLDIGAGRYVNIFTEPASAAVSVNGQSLGLSPIYNQYLPYGEHTVKASSGFMNGEETVSISPTDAKEARTVTIQMEEMSEEEKAKALDETNIKPANVSPPQKLSEGGYYAQGARVVRLNLETSRITPAPQLEKFANMLFFGDTVSTTLDQGIERFLSTLGNKKKRIDQDVTFYYNIRMALSDFRDGYYYSYYLCADYGKDKRRPSRECFIIYDATTDRILSVSDVFNEATIKDINDKTGKSFKHLSIADNKLTLQYKKGEVYESELFTLDDSRRLKPYFLALVNKGGTAKATGKSNAGNTAGGNNAGANGNTKNALPANEFTDGTFRYKILFGNEVSVSAEPNSSTKIVDVLNIPSSVSHNGKTYTVSAIDNLSRISMSKLVIPSTIKHVETKRLNYLPIDSLRNIVVDKDNTAFCSVDDVLMTKDRKKLVLYPSAKADDTYAIPNTVETIGENAFYECRLERISIPATTKTIERFAFGTREKLLEFSVNSSNPEYKAEGGVLMTKDGKTLLYYPSGKPDTNYSIPNTVEVVESSAFPGCKLERISIPATTTSIYYHCFNSCKKLIEFIVDDNNPVIKAEDGVLMSKDGKNLFSYPACKPDSSYVVPTDVKIIKSMAFSNSLLRSLYINNENISIEEAAFYACRNLSKVKMPSKLTYTLKEVRFYECNNLDSILVNDGGSMRKISAAPYKGRAKKEETKVFDVVEEMPEFPGGQAELFKFLSKNTHYPKIAELNRIEGRVIVTFVVERDGSITDVKVAKSVDPSLDKEAVRVVKSMPKWKSGKQNGEAVRVKFTVPITFRLTVRTKLQVGKTL